MCVDKNHISTLKPLFLGAFLLTEYISPPPQFICNKLTLFLIAKRHTSFFIYCAIVSIELISITLMENCND